MAYESYLAHYGIEGMRWGVRRFQNEDGTLTELGKKRYGEEGTRSAFGTQRDLNKLENEYRTSKSRYEQYSTFAQQARNRAEFNEKKNGKPDEKNMMEAERFEFLAEGHKQLANRGANFIKQIIEKTLKSGKSVYSRDYWETVTIGENFLEQLTTDPIFNMTVGTAFQVKDDGKGQRLHERTLDPSRRKKVSYYYY